MSQKLTSKQIISFSVWRDDEQEIPKEHENNIKESAVRRIREMTDQGYLCGQLCVSIYNQKTDQEEEYSGWWDVSEPEPECAANSHQAMKEAIRDMKAIMLVHQVVHSEGCSKAFEEVIKRANKALTIANGKDKEP